MKKLIGLLVLFGIIVGCEFDVHPRPATQTVIVEPAYCMPNTHDVYWASYCEDGCCYYKEYNAGWICEEAWCYSYYSCQWEYATTFCY